ncbi:MAG: cob(I)yrinic acid a,c-diamide adenosyltransferase [bacterium]
MIEVYTGDGKGKTTAAFGLALRALGHNWQVLIVQFMKGDPEYGEVKAVGAIPGIKVHQFGLKTFVKRGSPEEKDVRRAKEGLEFARQALKGGNYQMVILDEINVAIDYGLLSLNDVLELVHDCPADVELVLTGRNAKPQLIAVADLVSEVKEIKHPYQQGFVNRVGIDR